MSRRPRRNHSPAFKANQPNVRGLWRARTPECRCSQYIYNGERGEFVSNFGAAFDFDAVMSRISGAYQRERD